jgi:hypothetical protein
MNGQMRFRHASTRSGRRLFVTDARPMRVWSTFKVQSSHSPGSAFSRAQSCLGSAEGCFRRQQMQNLLLTTSALQCSREAEIGTAAKLCVPGSASTFRGRNSGRICGKRHSRSLLAGSVASPIWAIRPLTPRGPRGRLNFVYARATVWPQVDGDHMLRPIKTESSRKLFTLR